MVKDQKSVLKEFVHDTSFLSPSASSDFFKRKNRSRAYDSPDNIRASALSWNNTGTLLACAGIENRGISIGSLDEKSCRVKQTSIAFESADEGIEAVEFSKHDEFLLASSSNGKTVRTFDVRSPKTPCTTKSVLDTNLFLSWTHCGNFIVLGDKSDTISLLDRRINKVVESVSFKVEINEFICHPNGEYIFITTDHGKLEIFSLPKLKRVKSIQAHPPLSSCQSIAMSPNENYIVVGGSDACCSIWDLRDLICVQTLTRLDYPIRTVSFSHCGNLIASGSEDRLIDIAWASTGEKVAEVPIQAECFDVAWHPRLYLLAYATGLGVDTLRDRDRDNVSVRIFGYSG
ncbi:THO complex subunit 3 [Ditylenchus destructor]|uniref:THO complex subunit 3 n=1 Tax=Ditylenchus destructor TaxID=166010 RepID=A0AAD4NAV1_9BILA|nr:THO complex subunit 3 [Ditylenchus destructor]